MKIYLPYTDIHELTLFSLRNYEYDAVELEGPRGYPDLLSSLWGLGEDFVVVEHDVVFLDGMLEELVSCPEEWCVFKRAGDYELGQLTPTLCLARFRKSFIEKLPSVWYAYDGDWSSCDVQIADVAKSLGLGPHWHFPAVINVDPSNGLAAFGKPSSGNFFRRRGTFWQQDPRSLLK